MDQAKKFKVTKVITKQPPSQVIKHQTFAHLFIDSLIFLIISHIIPHYLTSSSYHSSMI